MTEPIEFVASFPPIQSAIKSGRDGARIQLDIPASEMPAIVRLLGLAAQETALRVTIQVEITKDYLGNDKDTATSTYRGTACRPTDMAGR